MLCRTSRLVHPASGVSLETPLLIPSFSSKAFGFDRNGEPELLRVLSASKEFITRTCLISAYDVHYGYIPEPHDLPITVDLMFLDSGGYEVSSDHDLSSVEKPAHRPKEWDPEKLQTIVDRWPAGLPAVFVSYDHPNLRRSVGEQLRDARRALPERPRHLQTFLLKPQANEDLTLGSALEALEGQIGELSGFHIVGVTEKEIGSSPIERMVRIAGLRRALDGASLPIPIHVFGALDPLSICLYLVAGAEVFDGLTWCRYAYSSGECTYVQNRAAMAYGLHVNDDEARVRTIQENMRYLDRLEHSLRRFAETGDWEDLVIHREFVREATEQLRCRL